MYAGTGCRNSMSTPTPLPYYIVDAFTTSPFSGNPASVVLFPDTTSAPSDSYLLSIAREFNLSETAYLIPLPSSTDQSPNYSLRWFTVTAEFPLCGHATLASTHVLLSYLHKEAASVRFETMSGVLYGRRWPGRDEGIELDFPADETVLSRDISQAELDGVRLAIEDVVVRAGGEEKAGWKGFGDVIDVARGRLGWIIELKPRVELEKLKLDIKGFSSLGGYVVFTQAGDDGGIKSRVLDPVEDIQEDPVTGSAHCMLAPYWLSRATSRLEAPSPVYDILHAKQVSARGGILELQWDRAQGRVKLRGQAVTVMNGALLA